MTLRRKCEGCGLLGGSEFPNEPSVRERNDGIIRCDDCDQAVRMAKTHESESQTISGDLWLKLRNAERANENQSELLRAAVKLALNQGEELKRWRSGGVTEELLRRGDGYVKVGHGCVIIRQADYDALRSLACDLASHEFNHADSGAAGMRLAGLIERAKLIQ